MRDATTTPPLQATSDTRSAGRYRNAGHESTEIIARRIEDRALNMLFAGASISEEATRLALVLDRLAVDSGGSHRHYSFFANSSDEATYGAVKLLRHNAVIEEESEGKILIVDLRDDHKSRRELWAIKSFPDLHPGIFIETHTRNALQEISSGSYCGVVVVHDQQHQHDAVKTREAATKEGIRTAVANFATIEGPDDLFDAGPPADVYVFGENLSNFQVPFGCMVITHQAYRVWNNVTDSLAHTSTFGGNGNCLAIVEQHLRTCRSISNETENSLRQISQSKDVRNRYFRRHVNPSAGAGLEMFGQDFDVVAAQGMTLHLRNGQTLLDCAGGTGASLRGHNPTQPLDHVFNNHDSRQDYLASLTRVIQDNVGDYRVIPAVSGATAVDNALYLAALAAPGSTIITFRGNYSGKTLPSISLSKHGPQRSASHPKAFAPYNPRVIYIDPFNADAVSEFRRLLSNREVGLVWLELIQGMQCRELPDPLVQAINDLRQEFGYLIGIDEVLTGYFRAGENFLYQHDVAIDADLTSLAKPLSDMIVPFGATLAKQEVVNTARRNNPDAVEAITSSYYHPLGCHIAANSIEAAHQEDMRAARKEAKKRARKAFDLAAKNSTAFSTVEGTGLLLRLVPNRKWFPEPKDSMWGQTLEASLQDLMVQKSGVLLAQQRLFAPLCPPRDDFAQAMTNIAESAPKLSPTGVYLNTAIRIAHSTRQRLVHKLKARINK